MSLSENIRRAVVPTAVVAGIAAIGAGVWPAIASDGGESPELPEVTAEELLVRVAQADAAQLSGTVRVDADLGLPADGLVGQFLDRVEGPAGRLAQLATGESTLRVALDGPERQRIGLVDGEDEFSVIRDGDQLWAYDSAGGTVLSADLAGLSEEAARHGGIGAEELLGGTTPQQAAERLLAEAGEHADITVDGTARIAGRDAYEVLVEPTEAGSPVERVRISVDSATGVPLAVDAEGEGRSLEVAFTEIEYAQPAGSVFEFTPPSGAEVLEVDPDQPFGGLLEELLPEGFPEGLSH
ncbi:hypothetical protein RM780_19600 [Streptomyces sp. DSM 44917]|uniref:MucB/RseB N-terminal domain-containing protein n=1 Tax=Streptomyces boetiae TaxID=3075541 RepID=A0ABU2LCB4_9ACTN|nr:hypothetical protein [Streptomyces sp. DSM 44917]MDT0309150.1 hypothetical protein [Streptomyces sp. DSM 44917]